MTWNNVLIETVNLAFKIILTLGIPYLFAMITAKIDNDHVDSLLKEAEKLVVQSVQMVNQTFVDSLKKEGKFDTAAQLEAFKLCRENWLEMVSDEMKETVMNQVGNIETWLNTKIESTIAGEKTI